MSGFTLPSFFRQLILALGILWAGRLVGSSNNIQWDQVNLPRSGSAGHSIQFTAVVTNLGDAWGGDHYLEMRDNTGEPLQYVGLENTARGRTRTQTFDLTLPASPGSYTYHFMALQHGTEYFGASVARTILVRAPLEVSLEIEDSSLAVGEQTALRTRAGPDERIAGHGIEARVLGGAWRKWAEWLNEVAGEHVAVTQIQTPGVYDVRAYAMRQGEGPAYSASATLIMSSSTLPHVVAEVWNFGANAGKRAVPATAAQVGDVVTVTTAANLTAGTGWRHNVLVRRPGISANTAVPPEDGSGFINAAEAWNKEGWGSPHTDGNSYLLDVTGVPAADLGNRAPFMHSLATGQAGSTRTMDFVLDAPGAWLIRAEVLDGEGQLVAASPATTVVVRNAALIGDPSSITYPYGRDDRFVGVFWNAGQAHRLWSTWRADFPSAYPVTWASHWKLMWQPSPYFRQLSDSDWVVPEPLADSPWQSFWSAHQVYALIPDGAGGSTLTHDMTSQSFAEKAAVRLMDIGVDFVAVDYTNQFLEAREDVFPAVSNLALAFQSVGQQSQSGQRIKLTAVVPANITSGDWAGNGGFTPVAVARFNAKLTILYNRFAHDAAGWFHLEDDNGVRKPLLLLWIGAGGEGEPDGKLGAAYLNQLRLHDGRSLTDVFTIRWVGAYLAQNHRFVTGQSYTVAGIHGPVTGRYANPKFWSYHEHFPSAAAVMPGATGPEPAVEAITVQPLAPGRDRFGRVWHQHWPAGQGMHYETPASNEPVPLGNYGRIWSETLAAARALNPKFLLTTWAEFGSENDEPRPELSVTVMDNNKFGTHFGDAFKQAVRRFKYRAPTGWIDTFKLDRTEHWISDVSARSLVIASNQTVQLQGWVSPNVANGFVGGSVRIYVDDALHGTATVSGTWNGATRWIFDLSAPALGTGQHTVKVLFDDGVGGSSLAGVRFRGERATSVLVVEIF